MCYYGGTRGQKLQRAPLIKTRKKNSFNLISSALELSLMEAQRGLIKMILENENVMCFAYLIWISSTVEQVKSLNSFSIFILIQ